MVKRHPSAFAVLSPLMVAARLCVLANDMTSCSLLLAACSALLLALAGHHLSQHHDSIAVHECDAGEALAILEGVADKRLLRLEAALSHLVGLQRVGILHLLAARLLSH